MQKLIMLVTLTLLILLVPVQSQPLTVTWRGNDITNRPTLIYHDEVETVMYSPPPTLSNPNGSRGLLCSSTVGPIAWHPGDGSTNIIDTNLQRYLYQIIPSGNLTTQIVNDGRNANDLDVSEYRYFNGLFTCRRNGDISTAVPVGFYQRGGRRVRGVVRITGLSSITSSSFMAASPSFTLAGDTEGGPPETYTWTRNGAPITNGGSYSISIGVNGVTDPSAYDDSRYRSTLTVTGRLPGVYQYSVSNRATPNTLTSNINIEGSTPTNLMVRQNGIGTALVSWTAPSPPPSMGYRITIDSTDFSAGLDVASSTTSHTISLQPGVHSIRMRAHSQHYPSEIVGPVEVTVKDFPAPTITSSSITATSVTITWSQPEGSLAADDYTISLQRLTGSNRQLCPTITDSRQMTITTTSTSFTNLQEFSIYTVTVTARAFGVSRTSTPHEFITTSTVPTGSPQNVYSAIARSVSVSWNEIECIERNGMITNYTVEFSSLGGSGIPGVLMVNERRFIASGLTPFTNYTFRVAGVNRIGAGPFSDLITIQTAEDTPGPVSNLGNKTKFTSIDIMWSAPQNPNGVILRYEISYTVNDSTPIMFNITISNTIFTIPRLTPGTRVFVSVRAYTSVGQGEAISLNTVTLSEPPVVMNVRVEELTSTSVRVSWDRIDITEITNYTVYYSATGSRRNEQSITVSSFQNSVMIDDLLSNVEYQFQVAAVALLYGNVRVKGQRFEMSFRKFCLSAETCGRDIAIAVVVSILFILVLNNTIWFIILYICNKHTKKKEVNKAEHIYASAITSGEKLEMNACMAYGQVTAPHEVPLSANSEGVYDNA